VDLYRIEMRYPGTENFVEIGTARSPNSEYAIGSVNPRFSYTFRIKGCDEYVCGEHSPEATAPPIGN
jgi:hypothetical protein